MLISRWMESQTHHHHHHHNNNNNNNYYYSEGDTLPPRQKSLSYPISNPIHISLQQQILFLPGDPAICPHSCRIGGDGGVRRYFKKYAMLHLLLARAVTLTSLIYSDDSMPWYHSASYPCPHPPQHLPPSIAYPVSRLAAILQHMAIPVIDMHTHLSSTKGTERWIRIVRWNW